MLRLCISRYLREPVARERDVELVDVRGGGGDASGARQRGRHLRDHHEFERGPRRSARPRHLAEQEGGAGARPARQPDGSPERRVRAHRGGHAHHRGGRERGETAVRAVDSESVRRRPYTGGRC